MKRLVKHFSWLLLIVAMSACETNEIVESVELPPTYFVEGTIDGEPISIQVGPENMVAETGFQNQVGDETLPVFSTSIFNSNCPECNDQLYLEIIGEESSTADPDVLDYLPLGTYSLAVFGNQVIENEFQLEFSDVPEMFSFIIIDENAQFVHTGADVIAELQLEDGTYSAIINAQTPGGCDYSNIVVFDVMDGVICSSIPTIHVQDGLFHYEVDMKPNSFTVIEVNGEILDLAPFETIPVSEILNGQPFLSTINVQNQSGGCVSQSVWENNGCMDIGSLSNMMINNVTTSAAPALSARLKYINTAGDSYVSQSLNSGSLNIISIEPNMNPTLPSNFFSLIVNINATLYAEDGSNESIELVIDEGVIPVSL